MFRIRARLRYGASHAQSSRPASARIPASSAAGASLLRGLAATVLDSDAHTDNNDSVDDCDHGTGYRVALRIREAQTVARGVNERRTKFEHNAGPSVDCRTSTDRISAVRELDDWSQPRNVAATAIA